MLTKSQMILIDQFLSKYWEEFCNLCDEHGENADLIIEEFLKE